jgi:hypothetical protein
MTLTYLFIIRFLARCALIGARRCSSVNLKRRAAFTSLADSDPGHLEAHVVTVTRLLVNFDIDVPLYDDD